MESTVRSHAIFWLCDDTAAPKSAAIDLCSQNQVYSRDLIASQFDEAPQVLHE